MSKRNQFNLTVILTVLFAVFCIVWFVATVPPMAPPEELATWVPPTATATALPDTPEVITSPAAIFTPTTVSTLVEITPTAETTPEPIAPPEPLLPEAAELISWAANLRICAGVECPAYGWASQGNQFFATGACIPASDGGVWAAIPLEQIEYIHPNIKAGQWVGQVLFINSRLLSGIDC